MATPEIQRRITTTQQDLVNKRAQLSLLERNRQTMDPELVDLRKDIESLEDHLIDLMKQARADK